MTTLFGRHILLRPLEASDFPKWQEVRRRNAEWLTKWEPQRLPGQPDVVEDAQAFSARCSARQRERQFGTGYGFGVFVSGAFAGEINLNSIQRGPFQNAYAGYWVDEAHAGQGYIPEAFVVVARFAFEETPSPPDPGGGGAAQRCEPSGCREARVSATRARPGGTSRSTGSGRTTSGFAMTSEDWAERGEDADGREVDRLLVVWPLR